MKLAYAIALTILVAGEASAQDAMTNNWGSSWAMGTLNRNTRDTLLDIVPPRFDTPAPRGKARNQADVQKAGALEFPYTSTPASRQAAERSLLATISRNDAAAAKRAAEEMKRQDFRKIYAELIAKTPFRANDAADTLAAYLGVGYAIANGTDTTNAQERGIRSQVALRARADPGFAPANRAGLADELKLMVVALHGGYLAARNGGTDRAYSDETARMFAANGIDLRALRLTDQGFAAR